MKRLDETIERDLEAVDRAVAAGTALAEDRDERALQELALELGATTPVADPEFASRLRAQMEAGFPPEPGSARAALHRPPLRRLLPALGFACVLVVSGGIALTLQDSTERPPPGDRAKLPEDGAGSRAAPAPSVAAPPSPPAADDFAPGRERRIERSASLTLAAPGEELQRVADAIAGVAERHRGFVLRSSVTSGEDGASGGSFELRVPADRLRPALRDLGDLATVRSLSQNGQDVTRLHATLGDRLEAARAERRSLLRRLERAGTDAEIEALRRRLDLVAREIRGLRAQLRELRLRTDYAALGVELVAEDDGSGASGGTVDDALDDAIATLEGALGLTVRTLAVLIPAGLVGAMAWVGVRALRRRRRESALA
jgi:hypothetical protein